MGDASAWLDSFFRISERGSDVRTELKGGLITFLAMVYILTVNPYILMDGAGAYANFAPLFTATCLAAIFACLLMGLYARFPVALAPGMGINAFLAYTICLTLGFNYPQALMTVFISGLLFFVLSIFGVRERIMNSIPKSFRMSITAGIGFFIAYIGLVNAGIIVNTSPAGLVPGFGDLSSGPVVLAILSIVITLALHFRGSWYAGIAGILISCIIGLIFGIIQVPADFYSAPDFSYAGILFTDFEMFDISMIPAFLVAILSLLMVDMFDTVGTLLAVGGRAGMIDDNNQLVGGERALHVDAIGTIAGSLFGTSTTTSYVESQTGIEAGARTGLAAVTVGLLFIIALFFSPFFGMITYACTTGVLVLVGVLMLGSVKEIDWSDGVLAASSFMTIFVMGLSYSISNGIGFGVITYLLGMIITGRTKEMNKVMMGIAVAFIIYFVLVYGVIPML